MFDNLEKLERVLLNPCSYFSLKNVVMLGQVNNKDKKRLNPVSFNSYKTKKYSNKEYVESISLKSSEFLVLSYNNINEKINEDIFISYPHLYRIKDAFSIMLDAITSNRISDNDLELFIECDGELYINSDCKEFHIKVGNLSNGKSIILMPDIINDYDGNDVAGVRILMNSSDNDIAMDLDTFNYTANYILDFNLQSSSMMLMNLAASIQLEKMNSDYSEDIVTPVKKKIKKNKEI